MSFTAGMGLQRNKTETLGEKTTTGTLKMSCSNQHWKAHLNPKVSEKLTTKGRVCPLFETFLFYFIFFLKGAALKSQARYWLCTQIKGIHWLLVLGVKNGVIGIFLIGKYSWEIRECEGKTQPNPSKIYGHPKRQDSHHCEQPDSGLCL